MNNFMFQGVDWGFKTELPDWARDDFVYPVEATAATAAENAN